MHRFGLIKIYSLLSILPLCFCGCFKQGSSISALCEKDSDERYILKWETTPYMENALLNIYVSDNDSTFPAEPSRNVNSDEFISVVEVPESMDRPFFKLKVGSTTSGIIANRFFKLDSVQNFRDIGGYYTRDNRQVKWGKVYRSGSFSRMTVKDEKELSKLNIKTVIDLRSQNAIQTRPLTFDIDNYMKEPINTVSFDGVRSKIIDNKFYRGDALIYMQDIYKDLVENQTEHYATFFEHLTDESNYPIAYNCHLGKDQTGLASYFLLLALGVPSEVAEIDYMASNIGIDKEQLMKNGEVSETAQEAMTTITNSDLSFLRFAISCITKKSGSVDDYMTKELMLTVEKRKQLRKILLY